MSVSWHCYWASSPCWALSVRGNETLHPADWGSIQRISADTKAERPGNQLSTSYAWAAVDQSGITWEDCWRCTFQMYHSSSITAHLSAYLCIMARHLSVHLCIMLVLPLFTCVSWLVVSAFTSVSWLIISLFTRVSWLVIFHLCNHGSSSLCLPVYLACNLSHLLCIVLIIFLFTCLWCSSSLSLHLCIMPAWSDCWILTFCFHSTCLLYTCVRTDSVGMRYMFCKLVGTIFTGFLTVHRLSLLNGFTFVSVFPFSVL